MEQLVYDVLEMVCVREASALGTDRAAHMAMCDAEIVNIGTITVDLVVRFYATASDPTPTTDTDTGQGQGSQARLPPSDAEFLLTTCACLSLACGLSNGAAHEFKFTYHDFPDAARAQFSRRDLLVASHDVIARLRGVLLIPGLNVNCVALLPHHTARVPALATEDADAAAAAAVPSTEARVGGGGGGKRKRSSSPPAAVGGGETQAARRVAPGLHEAVLSFFQRRAGAHASCTFGCEIF